MQSTTSFQKLPDSVQPSLSSGHAPVAGTNPTNASATTDPYAAYYQYYAAAAATHGYQQPQQQQNYDPAYIASLQAAYPQYAAYYQQYAAVLAQQQPHSYQPQPPLQQYSLQHQAASQMPQSTIAYNSSHMATASEDPLLQGVQNTSDYHKVPPPPNLYKKS